jgi:hypothetical protein
MRRLCRTDAHNTSGFLANACLLPCGSSAFTGRVGAERRGARYHRADVDMGTNGRLSERTVSYGCRMCKG